jgi:hypothetical protein
MDDNPFQPGAKVHIKPTNRDGILKQVLGETCLVELPSGMQVSVATGDIESRESRPAAGEHPILGTDTSSGLDS